MSDLLPLFCHDLSSKMRPGKEEMMMLPNRLEHWKDHQSLGTDFMAEYTGGPKLPPVAPENDLFGLDGGNSDSATPADDVVETRLPVRFLGAAAAAVPRT